MARVEDPELPDCPSPAPALLAHVGHWWHWWQQPVGGPQCAAQRDAGIARSTSASPSNLHEMLLRSCAHSSFHCAFL